MGSTENLRNLKSRKPRQKLPRSVKEMSKEALQLALIKKKECNAKALQIVERLLENNITEDWFLESLKFISVCHLEDIIEERAISKNCGYPLCHNTLKNVPSQQYRISTKLNKVYDITERKHFCSNDCYKASNYVKDQMLTSPLWLRDKEEIPKFKLIPLRSESGGAGEEVDIGQSSELRKELKELQEQERNSEFTSVSQFTLESLSQLSQDVDRQEKKEKKERSERRKKMQKESENVKQENISPEIQTVTQHINHTEGSDTEDSPAVSDRSKKEEMNEIILRTKKLSLTEENQNLGTVEHGSSSITSSENVDVRTVNFAEEMPKSCTPEASRNIIKQEDCTVTESANISSERTSESNQHTSANVKTETKVKGNKEKVKLKKSKSGKQESATTIPNAPPAASSVIHIEKCLYEWFTIDSMCFLFGEEKVKQMVSEKGECIKEYYKAVHNSTWDPRLQEQYAAICRRLNIMELEDTQYDSQVTRSEQNQQKPLPDYSAVKEEGKRMELKVRAFYKGQLGYEDRGSTETRTVKEDEPIPVLPLVDLHAQNALRRRIVLDRLNRVLPDLLRTFGLTSRDIGSDVRNLVASFSLGAHNIMFKPPEWSLIGLIIIKMISIKDIRLKLLLESEQVTKYITLMLIAFQQDGGYLERLMAWLTDIDHLLQKQSTG